MAKAPAKLPFEVTQVYAHEDFKEDSFGTSFFKVATAGFGLPFASNWYFSKGKTTVTAAFNNTTIDPIDVLEVTAFNGDKALAAGGAKSSLQLLEHGVIHTTSTPAQILAHL